MVFLTSNNLPQKFLFLYIFFHENHQFLKTFQIIGTNGSLIVKFFRKLKPIFFDFEIFDKPKICGPLQIQITTIHQHLHLLNETSYYILATNATNATCPNVNMILNIKPNCEQIVLNYLKVIDFIQISIFPIIQL